MHPYDNMYVAQVARNQYDLFIYIRDELPGVDEKWFIQAFMKSHVRAMIDEGNPKYLNMPAREQMLRFIEDEYGNEYQKGEEWGGFMPGWTGKIYSLYQWEYNISSKELIEVLTLDDIERIFPALHQMGWDAAIDKIHEVVLGNNRETYIFSGGIKHPFSNYHPSKCEYEGLQYENGEAAFQSAKTLNKEERRKFQTVNPSAAKRMGRQLELRPNWEEVKYNVMLDILLSKFQEPSLKQMLLDTGSKIIVEDTTGWHDNEWGDCSCEKCKSQQGKNLLGKALVEIRTKILRDTA